VKFTTAWADTLIQNTTLKLVTALLSFCLLVMCVCCIKLALREPLVIERACYSTALGLASSKHSPAEIDAFVREALRQRFDSDATVTPGFLSPEEEGFKKQEQDSFKNSQMTQKIVVKLVTAQDDSVTVDADRVISVGQVRSAFVFPLSLTLSSTARNVGNPYGLILARVSQPKTAGKDTKPSK
jgi:hypothetical protein